MKNRAGAVCATIIIVAIVVFLAVDVGFSLYNPERLTSAPPVCTLEIISGDVMVQTRQSLSWEKVEEDMVLEPGSRIRTASGSHAALNFSMGTATKLEPDTDIIVTSLGEARGDRLDSIMLEQRSGRTWSQVASSSSGDYNFQIKTSSAEVKVRGTLFSTEMDKAGSTLVQTSEGRVDVSAEGEEVQVYAGFQTTVKPGEAPLPPVPIPSAKSELVLTVEEPAVGMVIDPTGSRAGFLPDGSPVNQIAGSQSSMSAGTHTITIREPEEGEYGVVLHGTDDGDSSFSIEGFTGGISTFFHTGSCNMTAASDMVMRLQLDVLDGLLKGAEILGFESSQNRPVVMTTTMKTTTKTARLPAEEAEGENVNIAIPEGSKNPGSLMTWLRQGDDSLYQRVFIAAIFVILVIVIAIVRRRN